MSGSRPRGTLGGMNTALLALAAVTFVLFVVSRNFRRRVVAAPRALLYVGLVLYAHRKLRPLPRRRVMVVRRGAVLTETEL
jgi:hypothetical protein